MKLTVCGSTEELNQNNKECLALDALRERPEGEGGARAGWFPKGLSLALALVAFFVLADGAWVHDALADVQRDGRASRPLFPLPPGLHEQVEFWKKVFTRYSTSQVILHDSEHPTLIYEVMDLKAPWEGTRLQRRRMRLAKRGYERLLRELARSGHSRRKDKKRERLRALFKPFKGRYSYRKAALNVRAQVGMRETFRESLIRSGLYIDHMRRIFRQMGLPEELTILPHVESGFRVRAFSAAGAAGIWQFTRGTGRLFLRIDYAVDERLDPILSTFAAARLLKKNFQELGNWPLAVTAYNHGLEGVRRAVERTGTRDILQIINRYRGRGFGFASKNFYAEFLAALHISKNYRAYFGPLNPKKPWRYEEFRLPDYVRVRTLTRRLGVPLKELRDMNPALRATVFRGRRLIPKGYPLRVKPGRVRLLAQRYRRLPPAERFSRQLRDRWYRVRRGDSLGRIAQRYRVRTSELIALNKIKNPDLLLRGRILRIPRRPLPKRITRPSERVALVPPAGRRSPAPSSKGPAPGKRARTPSARRSRKGYVVVRAEETLGHLAEWLNTTASRLRRLNGLGRRTPIRIGQRLRVSFARVSREEFEEKRLEYHKAIDEDFHASYRVEGTLAHHLKPGENIWELITEVYNVPFWLLKRYNPDSDLARVAPGEQLIIPIIARREASGGEIEN